MNSSIAMLFDIGTSLPHKWIDPVIAETKRVLSVLEFEEFAHVAMYLHLLGAEPNNFGLQPGVVLRLNRRENEMTARVAIPKSQLEMYKGFAQRRAIIVDGVISVLGALKQKYPRNARPLIEIEEELERFRCGLVSAAEAAT